MKLMELQKLTQVLTDNVQPVDTKRKNELLLSIGIDPNTFYQELEMTSDLVDTHRDISYSNAHIQLHSHAFFELIYCRNSCGAEYLIGADRYRLMRGDLIFVPPGVSHRPILPEGLAEPYKRYVLWMSPVFMERYANLFPYLFSEKEARPSMLRTSGTRWNDKMAELFRVGVEESERREDGWEAAVIGNTITLLTMIKRANSDQSAHILKAEKPELLDRIMEYIEAHYAENIVISQLAKTLYVSESTISHLFKEKLGISFYRYVTQKRLIEAKRLIEKELRLEEVAGKVGFEDYSGFYRAFKKEYGISPRQYRKL